MWGTPGSRISGRWSSLSHGRNSALSGLRVCPGRSSRGLREESPNPELLQLQIQISAPDLARPVEKALPTPGINKATHARILTGLAGVLHPRDGSPFSRGWVEKPGEPGSLGSRSPGIRAGPTIIQLDPPLGDGEVLQRNSAGAKQTSSATTFHSLHSGNPCSLWSEIPFPQSP